VIGTFVIVALLSFKNRLLQRLRKLREPRYLIGAIAGLAYFWFFFFRRAHSSNPALAKIRDLSFNTVAVDFVSVVVLLMMIAAWALPSDSGGLDFSEAEIGFLFPAPLLRRDLLLYKILRAQPQALFSAVMLTIIGTRQGYFIGTWVAFSVMSVYFTMVSQGRARLRLFHIGFLPRLGAVALIIGGLYSLVLRQAHTMARVPIPADYKQMVKTGASSRLAIEAFFQKPSIAAILFVPRFFASAALPGSLTTLAISILVVAALGVAFFYIAAALNVSFEEASISTSQRRAARMDRQRGQRVGSVVMFRRAPALFKLGETGPVEVAIIWKNLIALMRNSITWVVILVLITAAMLGLALWSAHSTHEQGVYLAFGAMLLFMAGFFPLVGPNVFANDLRLDMPRLEVLKSYPITGERLVAAEIAAPLAVISILEMMFASSASLLMAFGGHALGEHPNRWLLMVGTPQFIVTVLLLTLPVCAIQLLIRNAVPVLFPGWAVRSKDEPRGFVMTGQRLVTLAGNIVVLVVALIPAAIVFAPSLWLAYKFFSGNAAFVAVATMPAVAVLAAEFWFGVKALGAQFETLDVSNEMDVMAT
jgi:ABC-2 type transport system permease protein